jgi:hypothetical protein
MVTCGGKGGKILDEGIAVGKNPAPVPTGI